MSSARNDAQGIFLSATKRCLGTADDITRATWSGLLQKARQRAKRLGLEFDLIADDIEVPTICPVLGIPLVLANGKPQRGSVSLDRLDNSIGYVRGNVCVISYRANVLKKDATPEELALLLEYAQGRPRFG